MPATWKAMCVQDFFTGLENNNSTPSVVENPDGVTKK